MKAERIGDPNLTGKERSEGQWEDIKGLHFFKEKHGRSNEFSWEKRARSKLLFKGAEGPAVRGRARGSMEVLAC